MGNCRYLAKTQNWPGLKVWEGDVTFLGDEIHKGISIIIEVCITSLNAHFRPKHPYPKIL